MSTISAPANSLLNLLGFVDGQPISGSTAAAQNRYVFPFDYYVNVWFENIGTSSQEPQQITYKIPIQSGTTYWANNNINNQIVNNQNCSFPLSRINISVRDRFGNLLNNNGQDWSFSIKVPDLIHLNTSAEGVTKINGNPFQVSITLPVFYKNVNRVELVSAEIPAGFYNIRSPFNTFVISGQTYTILVRNYTINSLLDAMNTSYGTPAFSLSNNKIIFNSSSFTTFLFNSSNVYGNVAATFSQFQTPPSYTTLAKQVVQPTTFYGNPTLDTNLAPNWSLYNNMPGYQQVNLTNTGTYAVIAAGAPGGSPGPEAGIPLFSSYGGFAAILAGSFNFTAGQQLIMCVGQTGDSLGLTSVPTAYANPGRGGGGMTCIVDAANPTVPILVAAGGGGATCYTNSTIQSGGRAVHFVTSSNIPSAAGQDASGATSNNAGAGWGVDVVTASGARGFASGFKGGDNVIQSGVNTGTKNSGGWGGGGSGGLIASTSEIGGGGGGWIGGGAACNWNFDYDPPYYSYAANRGGAGGWSYCLTSTSSNAAVSPIYGNYATDKNSADNSDIVNGMVYLQKVTPLYSNFTITFTTCGATADSSPGTAPTWAAVSSNVQYLAQPALVNYLVPFFFAYRQGYQAWIVPYTASYTITAVGASGASGSGGVSASSNGVSITTTVSLNIGEILIITVGQGGPTPGGGGGMTTVHRNGCTSNLFPYPDVSSTNGYIGFPLICAAGGAGGGGTAGTHGKDVNTCLTGLQPTTPLPYSGVNVGSGIYSQPGRTNSWMAENIPNTGFNPRFGALAGLTGSGGWGGGGRSGSGTNIPGSGGGFYGGYGGGGSGSSSSPAWTGNSYCMTSFTVASAGNSIGTGGGSSAPGNDGSVTITQN